MLFKKFIGFFYIVVMERNGWIWELFRKKSYYLMIDWSDGCGRKKWEEWVGKSIFRVGGFFYWERDGLRRINIYEG